jgi:group I intron endonuclease
MIGIYKITSVNNKIYIGQSINIQKRFNNYKKLIHCNNQTKLYRSFLKYGIDNHTFEIIEMCKQSELNSRERYYQELYDVLNKGLNCRLTSTNDKSGKLSNTTKKKISISNTGKKCNDDKKLKISKANKGNIHSEETKIKISKTKIGTKHTLEAKIKIGVASKNRVRVTKKIINTFTNEIYNSISHVSKVSGISPSWLSKMLRGINNNTTIYKFIENDKY